MKNICAPSAFFLSLFLAVGIGPARAEDERAGSGPKVEMTWMSIANWYFRIGDLRIVMDGYITRLPGPPFFFAPPGDPGDIYGLTLGPRSVDTPAVSRVVDAVLEDAKLDYLLAGHSHFDHTWDTPTWSRLTGAPIIGGLSTCLQATSQNLPAGRCKVILGGERLDLGNGVTVRVVRFNHSGNNTNPIQHFARELSAPPTPDPVLGGFRGGVGEDYPNGGGGRAFLFTVEHRGATTSFFVQNSASAYDLDKDIIVDGVNYGAPLANLKAAMADAGLTSVDAWIGTGGLAVAQLIVPVIHPKVYIPNHWDGLFNPFWGGLPFPFKDDSLSAFLDAEGIPLMPQHQYMDTYVLTEAGVSMTPNHQMKRRLGFADVQPFGTAMLDALGKVASTSYGDDCGESTVTSPWARIMLTQFSNPAHGAVDLRKVAAIPRGTMGN